MCETETKTKTETDTHTQTETQRDIPTCSRMEAKETSKPSYVIPISPGIKKSQAFGERIEKERHEKTMKMKKNALKE